MKRPQCTHNRDVFTNKFYSPAWGGLDAAPPGVPDNFSYLFFSSFYYSYIYSIPFPFKHKNQDVMNSSGAYDITSSSIILV